MWLVWVLLESTLEAISLDSVTMENVLLQKIIAWSSRYRKVTFRKMTSHLLHMLGCLNSKSLEVSAVCITFIPHALIFPNCISWKLLLEFFHIMSLWNIYDQVFLSLHHPDFCPYFIAYILNSTAQYSFLSDRKQLYGL